MTKFLASLAICIAPICIHAQSSKFSSYCNPIDIDYTYRVYNANRVESYRSGADPSMVSFRGEYYMFVTRSLGYWHSRDLLDWEFIDPEKWYFQGSNAPSAFNYRDSLLYVMGDPSGSMSVLYTDSPKKGDWKAIPAVLSRLNDPQFFIDDDNRAYVFWGSSNRLPIYGQELDTENMFIKKGEERPLIEINFTEHGWGRFGMNHTDSITKPFIEGPWITKYNGIYYLQYAAPGTQSNGYGDGVYTSDKPLGPYTYQTHNPMSYKPGGFINGAGHGSTLKDHKGNYWHFATMSLSVNNPFERRIGMWPLFFDKDGIMWTDTYFGDYPHYAPMYPGKGGQFRGWMLLSYKKPVRVSGALEGFGGENMVDENVKTYWVAEANDNRQWAIIDLGRAMTVHAVQINYFDYQNDMHGRIPGLRTRYSIEVSANGTDWTRAIDCRNSFVDAPNAYVELENPVRARYVRYSNVSVPMKHLAIAGIRVFGRGDAKRPESVKNFTVQRMKDRRDAAISWDKVKGAQGYNVIWGIAPDKLYSSWMVYDDTSLLLKALTANQSYYFTIEAFNEDGVSTRTPAIKTE